MRLALLALVGAAALVLSGCAAKPAAVHAASTSSGAPLFAAASSSATLWLTPDGKLAPARPAAESLVPLPTPANSPFTGAYPSWSGNATAPMRVTNGTLHLFVTSSSASVRANLLPIFRGIPGIGVNVTLGNRSVRADVEGEPLVHAAHVVELVVPLALDAPLELDAGAPVALHATVYYTHVASAAEFDYVVGGPEHASRLDLG